MKVSTVVSTPTPPPAFGGGSPGGLWASASVSTHDRPHPALQLLSGA